MRDTTIIAAMAQAAAIGGAAGLRIEGLGDVAAVRTLTDLPLIGLVKEQREDYEIYITPTVASVKSLCRLGADIIALDATDRPRPAAVGVLIEAAHSAGRLAMADISNVSEARQAMARGADIVATTLSGYTNYTPRHDGPDFRPHGRAGPGAHPLHRRRPH